MLSPGNYLAFSTALFAVGLAGVLLRRNAIIALIGIELMLNAANINFVAFAQYHDKALAAPGIIFAMFSIGIAAAEAAVGLALILVIYRHFKTTDLEKINQLKG